MVLELSDLRVLTVFLGRDVLIQSKLLCDLLFEYGAVGLCQQMAVHTQQQDVMTQVLLQGGWEMSAINYNIIHINT